MLPKIDKILYATGLGAGAPHVFRYALSLAQKHEAKIIAVNAMEPLSTFAQSLVELHVSHERTEAIHKAAREQVRANLIERIERLCNKELGDDPLGRSRVSEIIVEEGQPAQLVLEQARKQGADIIVMGTHRHTVIGEALLGNTAHRVLHSSEIPVLLVRIPEGYYEEGF